MRNSWRMLLVAFSVLQNGSVLAQPTSANTLNCPAASTPLDRQRCAEALSQTMKSSSRTSDLAGGWRLVRSSNPGGGSDAISIMHLSDTSKSDVNLAGLTFRCGAAGIEMLVITLDPLPRGSHPMVSVKAGSKETQFEATAVQAGEALLLPSAGSDLLAGQSQEATELSLEIKTKPTVTRGVVPINGLSTALQTLKQSCNIQRD